MGREHGGWAWTLPFQFVGVPRLSLQVEIDFTAERPPDGGVLPGRLSLRRPPPGSALRAVRGQWGIKNPAMAHHVRAGPCPSSSLTYSR